MLVEAPGGLVDRVHHDGADRELLRGERDPSQRVAEQGCPQASVLMAVVNRESREDRHWDGVVARYALARLRGRLSVVELAGEERVVPDHDAGVGDDEGAGRIAALGLSRVAVKPAVERLVLGRELRCVVMGGVVALGGRRW